MTAKINKGPAFGQRHVQSLLIFFAIVVNYMGKFNASVAVVAMTNADTSNHDIPTYDWNEMERSYILSSFFWGYILTQFLGGWLCRRFGARITMFASTFGSAVMVILVPFFVPWGGWQSFCAIRGCMGAFQGMLFPSIHTHLANWCPPKERNRLGALSNTGIDFGSVVTMFVSGLIAASSIGWPGIFYVACGVEVLWCIFWLIFGANTPRQSKFISPEELEYIETTKNENKKLEEAKEMRQIPVPWKGILTSVPLWTLFLVRCTQAWGNSTLQAEIPAYMKGVLQMDMKSNALYSALPYLCSWILAFVYVIMADILLTRGILTITGIRKLINSLSSWLPAIFLIGLGFLDSDQKTWAIVLMCLSVGINAGSTIGCTLNTIDLSPNHAGILMGIVNTGGNGIPILTPLVVGVIVKNENDRAEWQVVFIISAVIFFVGNLFYVIFGQMVSQPWDAADFLDKQKASHIEENGEANLKAIEAKENAQQAEEKNISDQQEIKTCPAFGQRHVQSLLIFFAIVANYMGKFNASVAVVAMTNADTSNHDIPTYDWNEMERSYILSSFFWGYILTQFLGGWLCRRFGARITMFASTFGSAVMAILVPFFVPWGGWQSFCAIRGCMGAFQGMLFPSIHTHLANWCPPKERNRLGALSNTGIDFGTLLSMFASGLIAASSVGWPGIFYVSCGIGVLWCIFWLIFGANTPRQCKLISPEELEYIETSKNENNKLNEAKEIRHIPVPWKAILTSVPLWTLFLVRCTQSWGNSTLQAEIPAYMKGVLQMDMKSNALYSALPYLCSWILAFVYVIIADILQARGILTITGIRKLFSSLASWLPAIFLIGLGFLDSDQKTWAIVLMCLSVGINAGSTIGSALNTIDLSPNHAGILMGIVNTGGNAIPILTPLVVGVIVKNENDRAEWQVVFIISAVIFFVGNLFYVIFGQMVSQPWDAADFLDKQKGSHIEENGEANRKAIEEVKNTKQAEEKNLSDQQDIKT